MNDRSPTPSDSAVPSHSAVRRYLELCESGRLPDLRQFLGFSGDLPLGEVVSVCLADQRERWLKGERCQVEDYLKLWPPIAQDSRHLQRLVDGEVLMREELGESPSPTEYLQRFPDLSPSRSTVQVEIENVAGPPVVSPDATPQYRPDSTRNILKPSSPTVTVRPPQIENYEIVRELGRGGMGVVFLAVDPRLKRKVALKVLTGGGLGSSAERARFRLEAEVLATLQHPNIVNIFEVGEHNGAPFFAMEFAEAGSLAERTKDTQQPLAVAAEIVEILARAVHCVHERDIVHRDLKPSNVLLVAQGPPAPAVERGEKGLPPFDPSRFLLKITDFGLAKRLNEEAGFTKTGDLLGTPSYMAPEQADGKVQKIGPAVDIYALGTLLYELLTGRAPFRHMNPLVTIAQLLVKPPPPMSQFRPGIPSELEVICLKCLEKAPGNRYATALDLAEDLQRWRSARPIQAKPVPRLVRAARWGRRHPIVMTTLTLTLLSLTAVGTSFGYVQWRDRQQTLQLTQQVDQLLVDARAATTAEKWSNAQASVVQAQTLLAPSPLAANYQERVDELRTLIDAGRKAEQRLKEFQSLRDEALFYQAQSAGLSLVSDNKRTREAAQTALALFGLDTGPEQTSPTPAWAEKPKVRTACYELMLVWASALAEPTGRENPREQAAAAILVLDRAAQMGLPESRAWHLLRARCEEQSGNLARAEQEQQRARELEKMPGSALDYFLLGSESYRRRKLELALEQFTQALRSEPHHFWAEFFAANCYLKMKSDSETTLLRAREKAVRHLTACLEQRPGFEWSLILRAVAYGELNEYDQAEADYQSALDQGPASDVLYAVCVNRGVLRLHRKRYAEAITDFRQAAALRPTEFQSYVNLGLAYQGMQRLDEALEAFNQGIRLAPADQANPATAWILASLYRSRGRLFLARKNPTAALRDLGEASRLEPVGSSLRADDAIERGRILFDAKQYGAVIEVVEEALTIRPDDPNASQLRAFCLIELGRNQEALKSLDAALKKGTPTVDLYLARARARITLGDYAGASDDYTFALGVVPAGSDTAAATRARILGQRGWTYLFRGQPESAQRDFDDVIKFEPANSDALVGRGTARVKLGFHQEGVADSKEAMRLGPASHRLSYKAARVCGQAVEKAEADRSPLPNRGQLISEYQDLAVAYLRTAMEQLPESDRKMFWQDVQKDYIAFSALQRTNVYLRWKAENEKRFK